MQSLDEMSSIGWDNESSIQSPSAVLTKPAAANTSAGHGRESHSLMGEMGEFDEEDLALDQAKYAQDNALIVEGYQCPPEYMTSLTPMEFEEIVNLFIKFDSNKSGTIDRHETKQILHFLGMDFSLNKAEELLNIVDKDGSGEIDFREFCGFIVMIKRGDERLPGFNSLLEKLNSTPLGELERQARYRNLKIAFRVVDIRQASLTNPLLYVIELELSGEWHKLVNGEVKTEYGIRKYQGMGSSIRESKYAAATAAIVNLGDSMPGVKYPPGEFPEEWLKWVEENMLRGVDPGKIVGILSSKGFHPHRNLKLMHRLLAWHSLNLFLERNPDIDVTDMTNGIHEDFLEWIRQTAQKGIDGEVLLQLLEDRCIDIKTENPHFAQKLQNNELGCLMGLDGLPANVLDFWHACKLGYLDDVKIYCQCGTAINEENLDRHTSERVRPLTYAAYGGHAEVIKVLLKYGADIHSLDVRGRCALHVAAIRGHKEACAVLIDHGARLFMGDLQGNTPLHLAAMANQLEVVDYLALRGQDLTRIVCSDKVRVLKDGGFEKLVEQVFHTLPSMKLKQSDTVRFEKRWLHDAALLFVKMADSEVRHMIPRSCEEIMHDVLHRFDPRPETGIFVYDEISGDQVFIKTIPAPAELGILLKYVFRQAAVDGINKWRRTALHVACDANNVNSHEKVIDRLIEEYGCNVNLVDMHKRKALELLIQDKKVKGMPSATQAREEVLMLRRQADLDRFYEEFAVENHLKQQKHRDSILEECIMRAEVTADRMWHVIREASLFRKRYTIEWEMYEDPDTGNYFYVRAPVKSEYGMSSYSDYSWNIPREAKLHVDRIEALNYLKTLRSNLLRKCDEWEVYQEKTTQIEFYFNLLTHELRFSAPKDLEWKAILQQSKPTGVILGFGNEWEVYSDKYGNTFYRNKIDKYYEYEKPFDAVVVTPSEMLCTAFQVTFQ